ncbi:hypothetical protein BWI17_04265 [Betaproteobacteria bacterium GR16-43]|nr:hypothetical protein BWI17_04265 [Betaproteobacteria bacterium GR16-43]
MDMAVPGPLDAIANGRAVIELRPRYNHIEESDKPLVSEGFTYRAILGWASAPWANLRLTAELINTGHIGDKKYNENGADRTSPYPLLPDPDSTDVNRAFIDYTGFEATRLRAGRQLVRMDNQRWVSDNDFRNTPQLFDGVSGTNTAIANVELHASYYWRVRTTSGTSAPLNLTLLHAAWNPAPDHGLAAYAYFHDQAQNGAFTGFADNSYRVVGARAEGSVKGLAPVDLVYTAEAAMQRPFSGGDSRVDANYWRLGGGASGDAWTLRYDYEVKGSNNGVYGLQMPLTDFYGFNGWTLHFFNTPARGLRDQWLTGRVQAGPVVLYGESHRFKSDFGGLDYGKENDVGLTWLAMDGITVRLQHARYRPGTAQPPQPRITKTWLSLTYTY